MQGGGGPRWVYFYKTLGLRAVRRLSKPASALRSQLGSLKLLRQTGQTLDHKTIIVIGLTLQMTH